MTEPFRNEPIVDFSRDEEARRAQRAALGAFRPVQAPVVIGGKRLKTRAHIDAANPCAPGEIVGVAGKADPAMAKRAIEKAYETFASWSRTPPGARAGVLFRAAGLMRQRRWELNATLILEVAKTWTEADADTAEAIDFCEYYGREMLRLAGENPVTPVPGEKNRQVYLPLGVGAVISPWNFPCAILTGMTAAALVTGNTVVLKPASVSPIIAFKVFEIFEEAGVPAGALNYLPAGGGEVGDLLVDHPLTRFIAFTGSKEVGVRIHERAAVLHPGQLWLKRTVVEMGGKDAILVDDDADLEAASAAIVQSAFGFQGQKCSACSRAIATAKVYDRVLDLVLRKTAALKIGDARDPESQVSAVASARQLETVLDYIRIGKRCGRLVAGGRRLPRAGYFVEPAVFADVNPKSRLGQEEVFGPVLAFMRARDFGHALRIANGTPYGLTGSHFGEANWKRAAEEFHVGNLYHNRKCTGAWVGGHPFGGFNLSGTDSKAGGRDYLGLFLQAQLISEKVS
jgi:1-pyrroline-5-carboxylate dehydrogenase